MKKQIECKELTDENMALRNELNLIADKFEKFASKNVSLKEKLRNLQGEDRVEDSERNGPRETMWLA